MEKHSKIFVAGGSGMVGSAVIRKLLEMGYENIISNYYKCIPLEFKGAQVRFFQLDLRDQQKTEAFFKEQKPDYVFLCAAKVGGIVANNTYKAEFIYDNLAIALHIIHSAYKYRVIKLLNLGSSCIYPKFAPQPMKEEYLLTGPLESTNEPYAIAKIAAIKLCRYYNEQYGTNFISLMPTNLYGYNDNFDLETSHVLPALMRRFHLGKCLEEDNWDAIRRDLNKNLIDGVDGKSTQENILGVLHRHGIKASQGTVTVEVWGSGNVYREFLYVDDLAEGAIFLMERVDASMLRGITPDYFVNIGTGKDILIKDLALMIKEIVGFKGQIAYDTSKPEGTPRKLLDISKIRELGWEPKTSLEEGIRKTYEWYNRY